MSVRIINIPRTELYVQFHSHNDTVKIVRGERANDWFEMSKEEWTQLVLSAPRLRGLATPGVSLTPMDSPE